MKTALEVVVLVDVTHETPAELREAIRDLRKDPPHRDSTSVGSFGWYLAWTNKGAQSVRVVKEKRARR